MQTLNEMLPILSAIEDHAKLCDTMLDCCLKHVVGNRPRKEFLNLKNGTGHLFRHASVRFSFHLFE